MAVAIVQELHGSTTGAGTITVTLGANFTAGNLILAFAGEDSSGTIQTPTVNGNAMTAVTNGAVGTAVAAITGGWYYRVAQSGDGAAVVATTSAGASIGCEVYELSGAGTPTGVASQTSNTSTPALTTQTITGSNGGMMFAGFFQNGLPGASRSYGATGFTDDIASNIRLQAAHKAGSGATDSTTLTTTNTNGKASAIINVPVAAAGNIAAALGISSGVSIVTAPVSVGGDL